MNLPASFVTLLACVFFTPFANASSVDNTTIDTIHFGKNHGNYVFVKASAPNTSPIACHSNLYWNYTLDVSTEQGKAMYAMLLMAYSSGSKVYMDGIGTCSDFSSVEALQTLKLMP